MPGESGSQDGELGSVERSAHTQNMYIIPQEVAVGGTDRDIDFHQLWDRLWSQRSLIIGIMLFSAIAAVTYAVLATKWYRAEVVLAPADERSAVSPINSTLSGLAALAGVSVGGADDSEAVAILESRNFARQFIEDLVLLPVLFHEDWDETTENWRSVDPEERPDIRDGVEYFQDEVLKVSRDRQTSLVTLSIDWVDPDVAAEWANLLVKRLNEALRQRALREAGANIAYLQHEKTLTGVVSLQESISRLLEAELQKMMLARGNAEFVYRVIDPAVAPRDHFRPREGLVLLVGAVLGFGIAIGIALLKDALRRGV